MGESRTFEVCCQLFVSLSGSATIAAMSPTDGHPDPASTEFAPKPITLRSAAVQIADQLRAAIADGSLSPGDRLPPEVQLAEEYGVSRGTVREAVRLLAAEHLVASTRGANGGTFVQLPEADAVAEQVGHLIALWLRAGDVSLAEVSHARSVLERECVRLAALNRTENLLAAIRWPVEESRNPSLGLDEWLATDIEFHTAISKAAANRILELAMTAVHLVRPVTNTVLLPELERGPVVDHHWAMYEAIRDRDPDGAVRAFDEHAAYLRSVQRASLQEEDSERLSLRTISLDPIPSVEMRRRHEVGHGIGAGRGSGVATGVDRGEADR